MNYYYDVTLNLGEDNLLFYEWNDTDYIENYKKVPFFQVNSKTLNDFLKYNVVVSEDFIETIKNKTKGGSSKYLAIFADKNGVIALEFNKDGTSINRSTLQVDDELNILEILYTTLISNIKYTKLDALPYNNNLRAIDKIKRIISMEIKSLKKKGDTEKLKYLYLEWFSDNLDDVDEMTSKMEDKLKHGITDDELKIYNLIKLSYNKV